MIEFSKISKLE